MLIEAFNIAHTYLCEMQKIFLISFNKRTKIEDTETKRVKEFNNTYED